VADPGFLERGQGGEWPKATRGWYGEGCPLPTWVGSGEGLCPPQKIFEI